MFTKVVAVTLIIASTFSGIVDAVPLTGSRLSARTSPVSLNNWGGISSLAGFDDFFGSGNFANHHFSAAQITIIQEKSIVCRSQSARVVQQRLLILQEIAKRVITEQICEVETQTIIFEQFQSSFGGFGGDLGRKSGRPVGYDSSIASHIGSIFNDDGSLSTDDLGFGGLDLGKGYAVASGNNWDDSKSPSSVDAAKKAAHSAAEQDKQSKKDEGNSTAAATASAETASTTTESSAAETLTATDSSSDATSVAEAAQTTVA